MADFSDLDAALGAPAPTGSGDSTDLDAALGKPQQEPALTTGRAIAAPFVGFNKGVAETLGAPVDLVTAGMNKVLPEGYQVKNSVLGSEFLKHALGYIGANPDEHKPVSTTERYLQAAGEGAGQALGMEGAAVPLAKGLASFAPRTAEAVGTLFGRGNSVGTSAANAVVGAGGGAGGEIAADVAPEGWQPAARIGGSLVGGLAGAGAAMVPKGIMAAARPVGDYFRPFTEEGQRQVAAQRLREGFTDPGAVASRVADGDMELVPGSTPTTGQLTGDLGALSMEREAATAHPDEFTARREAQNAARIAAIEGVQQTGNPNDVTKTLRQNLDWLDQQTEDVVSGATRQARGEAAATQPTRTPEEIGSSLRGNVNDAKNVARKARNELYDAVDPNGSLNVVFSPVRKTADRLAASIGESTPMAGEEAAIVSRIQDLPDVVPFKSLRELDSRISAAMSEERRKAGESPMWGRLSQLKQAVAGAIDNGVENQIAHERALVANGKMAAEDTVEANIRKWQDKFYEQQENAARTSGVGNAGSSVEGYSGPAGVSRTNGPAGSGPRLSEGAEGVSGETLSPNFDPAAADRLNAAKEAHKDYAQTYRQGPVGETLRTNGFADNFRVPDSGVGAKAFAPGPKGGETAQAFLNANPQSRADIVDYASYLLHKQAFDPATGMIDPKRLQAFQKTYGEALKAFPEVANQFRNAASATEAVASANANRRAILDNYQQGAIGKIVGASTPDEVVAHVGSIFGKPDATAQMQRLAREAASDPNAKEGLRKAVVDHMMQKFISNTEVGASGITGIKSDQFQTFIRKNQKALEQVFTPDEVKSMQAVAADLQRSQRTLLATKLPGQSNTAQDTSKVLDKIAHVPANASLLTKIITGIGGGYAAHGVSGAIAGGSGAMLQHVAQTMHAAGIGKVDQLVREALLDPTKAHALLQMASRNPGKGSDLTFATALAKGLSYPQLQNSMRGSDEMPPLVVPVGRASGGRIHRKTGGRVEPTEAQKEAGNYKKHHIAFQGMQIAIENRKGSERSRVGGDGKPWSVKMPADYGYIKRTEGADGDHVDVYVGPASKSDKVFVIDQLNDRTGKFDEHKCMLGFANRHDAIDTYRRGFSDGKASKRLGHVTEMTVDAFKDWVRNGDTTKPLAVRRASGGRVITADQLLSMADRAKKNINKTTEPLLQQPDELIVKALDVAHKNLEAN